MSSYRPVASSSRPSPSRLAAYIRDLLLDPDARPEVADFETCNSEDIRNLLCRCTVPPGGSEGAGRARNVLSYFHLDVDDDLAEDLAVRSDSSAIVGIMALHVVPLVLDWARTETRAGLTFRSLHELRDALWNRLLTWPWPASYFAPPVECRVCMENVHVVRATTACGHVFHVDCLRRWERQFEKRRRRNERAMRRYGWVSEAAREEERSTCPLCRGRLYRRIRRAPL